MSVLPYIPPISPDDPPSPDLIVLFLEAIARVTPAFEDLRTAILPRFNPPQSPVNAISDWIRRYHLDFENHELRQPLETWVYNTLDSWRANPDLRDNLCVDCGWWDRLKNASLKLASDKPPIAIALTQWNPDREEFEAYATRLRRNFERLLQEQKRTREADLEKYNMRPYRKRETKRSPVWDFEWLALSICREMSCGEIALWTKREKKQTVSRDAIKKALQSLRRDLHITDGEVRD